ncbi:MAG: type II toxin-antitoxin system RelE/ParE family toxin [Terriglobales bacterium]
MTHYVLSADADRDLDEIWDYIAEDSIDAADQWIGRLFDAFAAIANTPGIGHKREDLTAHPVLFWPVGAYLVIYRAASGTVEVVAVTQGGRDIPAFLHRRLSR